MKALVLDPVTAKIVSMVYSQTQILEKEVYLVEILGKKHEPMTHLKAAVFIEPTEDNYDLLVRELQNPKFKEYHIFFSNIAPTDMIARLARLDENEVILQIQEYYGDYMAINEDLFSLGIENAISLSSSLRTLESGKCFDRNINGLLSVLLSLKKIPSQIRYSSSSDLARRLATDVLGNIDKGEPFDFVKQEDTMLLILDRRDDPITPLLTQWTYQAMVHELLGLNYNRVVLKGAPHVSKDFEEIVLSCTQDEFFSKHRYANFGDLGVAVKSLLEEYQKVSKKNENINSIEDMQNFLERFPDFRSKSINVSKHVAVIGELSRLTDVCSLLDISELEQEIACSNDHNGHKTDLLKRIRSPKVNVADKIRLSILYIIKYESYNDMNEIKTALSEHNVPSQKIALLDSVIQYCGESKRSTGLFSQGGMLANLKKTFQTTINGTQNVYTQHQPVLFYILQSIMKGNLKDSQFPPLVTGGGSSTFSNTGGSGSGKNQFKEIIIFMIGGTTFEEAYRIAEFNASNSGTRVLLGGSTIQNSTSFLKEIGTTFSR
jgi:vacuolar protein sorting-associated protein 45